MHSRFLQVIEKITAVLLLAPAASALAVSCISQSHMAAAERDKYVSAARAIAADAQKGDVAAVKATTLGSVAADFDGIAASIQALSPLIRTATLTVDSVYALDASDLKAPEDQTQFFCGIGNTARSVSFNIPQLPPGRYVLAIFHAMGVAQPQQVSMLLSGDAGGSWKLAGFFVRPWTAGGHDGIWYWKQAREYQQKKQDWNSYFYFKTAAYLLMPVDFVSSPNLEKLQKETSSVQSPGLPGEQPMQLAANSQSFAVTSLRTDGSLGGLDLVIHFQGAELPDPVAARTRNVEVMKAMLAQHPELRLSFHGLWVYADAPNQRSFAIELPMDQIK
jgi:hypothetical protein